MKDGNYHYGVYCTGTSDWNGDSCYAHYTQARKIFAVCTTAEIAQKHLDYLHTLENKIVLLPGQNYRRNYAAIHLDDPHAYASNQDVARFSIDVAVRRRQLLADKKIQRIHQ